LQQASIYSLIVAREFEQEDYSSTSGRNSLSFIGNLLRENPTDYLEHLSQAVLSGDAQPHNDSRYELRQLPLDRLFPIIRNIIQKGRDGHFDPHVLGNKLAKAARSGRDWSMYNAAQQQAEDLGSSSFQQQ
jgi:hypothetical protein